ncbi:hypothetical protein Ccrd_012355, partial [Cynara cardunculus var. scolymus]
MSSIVARTGRHLQRYDNNLRLVSGCIPYRLAKTEDQRINVKNRIEVLMGNSLGEWEFRSKSKQEACSEEGGCKGYLFALEWMRSALGEFVRVMEDGKNKREHEMLVEMKEEAPMTQEGEECQLMSTNCH